MLTQARLKELLHYDPETGIFVRIKKVCNHSAGEYPGYINDSGYLIINVDTRKYRAHRLAWLYMTGYFPEFEIDHENQNGLDNKFSNLRPATHLQNMKNVPMPSHNTSGIKGVSFRKDRNKWRASIQSNGKWMHLGYFEKIEDAAMAYKLASKSLHGKFGFANYQPISQKSP